MKARQLATLLENIVRKVIREELKSMVNESKVPTKKVKQIETDPLDVSHIFESKNVKRKPQKKMEFSKDNMVNQILNETYESNEWQNINGQGIMFTSQQAQGFSRGNMAEMLGYGSKEPTITNMTPSVDPDGRPIDVDLEGTSVGAALTRDYSSLMKTINAKKGK